MASAHAAQNAADSPIPAATPMVFVPGQYDSYRIAFQRELNPLGPVQQVVVNELARRARQMEVYDNAHRILASQIEKATAMMFSDGAQADSASSELASASALANERAESLFRQGMAATKAFSALLQTIGRLQAASLPPATEIQHVDPRFATEAGCLTWLARCFEEGLVCCPRCQGRAGGRVLSARRAWECGSCGTQTGLRSGTVMQSSTLPLVAWFSAIRILLLRPSTTASELAQLIHVKRVQTVAQMRVKILNAVAAETASTLLAGLDEFYLTIT